MADKFSKISELCKKYYDTYDDNCSGFVKAVADDLKISLTGQADDIVATIDTRWLTIPSGRDAAAYALEGYLVLVGLKAADHNEYDHKVTHGHIAIVAPGPLYNGKYPVVWCGGGIYGRSEGTKSVGEVWSNKLKSKDGKVEFKTADRDKVIYRRYAVSTAPAT
jgi:hypothetical protein